MIEVTPSTSAIGAEICGLNITQPLNGETLALIEQAFARFGVLIFRAQTITPEQHLAFTRYFGDIEVNMHSQYALPEAPAIQVISNIQDDSGKTIGIPDAGQDWHTDMSYIKKPPRCSLLYALEIPMQNGEPLGDTIFACAATAFEALDNETRAKLLGLKCTHSYAAKHAQRKKRKVATRAFTDEQENTETVIHPLVRTHPVTGRKCLYVVPGEIIAIDGVPDQDVEEMANQLAAHITKPAFQYRHRWQQGDLLMWDNCTVQHRVDHNFSLPLRRLMHRTTAAGSMPY